MRLTESDYNFIFVQCVLLEASLDKNKSLLTEKMRKSTVNLSTSGKPCLADLNPTFKRLFKSQSPLAAKYFLKAIQKLEASGQSGVWARFKKTLLSIGARLGMIGENTFQLMANLISFVESVFSPRINILCRAIVAASNVIGPFLAEIFDNPETIGSKRLNNAAFMRDLLAGMQLKFGIDAKGYINPSLKNNNKPIFNIFQNNNILLNEVVYLNLWMPKTAGALITPPSPAPTNVAAYTDPDENIVNSKLDKYNDELLRNFKKMQIYDIAKAFSKDINRVSSTNPNELIQLIERLKPQDYYEIDNPKHLEQFGKDLYLGFIRIKKFGFLN